jgi:hypothetical protein
VLPGGIVSVAGIGSFDGSNANFGPNAVSSCIAAGHPASQCNLIVQNTFLAPAGADPNGPIDAFSGDVVDFQLASGNLERNASIGANFVKFDASIHKTFGIPKAENVKIELRFDAFNVFNHSNWSSFNSNDVLTALPLSPDPACTNCQRLNGTFAGAQGQILNIANLRDGKVSSNLLPGHQTFGGLGDPAADDFNGVGPRRLQLSFRARF